jgi:beta-glucosidase
VPASAEPSPSTPTRWTAVAAELTLAEKCRLLGGASTWRTHPIERVGVPAVRMSDGPNGVRGEGHGAGRTPGVAVPVGIALGATWDPELVSQIGDLLGREAVRKGAHVLLAPTVNLQRVPTGGRVFECFSEDPELTAALAVPYVRGVQAHDVSVTVKHFVANDTEIDRMRVDVDVDEAVLRELYLRPFEAAVEGGGAWGVMSAYNRLGGEHCAENRRLLSDVLRGEWGFDGFVVSDWFGAHHTAPSANAGLTVPMPGPSTIYGARLQAAVEAGEVSEHTVDELVVGLLRLIERTRAAERTVDLEEQSVDDPDERALCRRAAAASVVLLRNEGGALPIERSTVGRIAVIGPNASATKVMGGGSSSLQALTRRSILDALCDVFGDAVVHRVGARIDKMTPIVSDDRLVAPDGRVGMRIEYRNGDDPDAPIVATEHHGESLLTYFGSTPPGVDATSFRLRASATYTPDATGTHELGLVVTGPAALRLDGVEVLADPDGSWPRSDNFFGYGSVEHLVTTAAEAGRPIAIEVDMTAAFGFAAVRLGVRPPESGDVFPAAVEAARHADVALVVVGTNDEWETEGNDRDTIALPGRQDELVASVAAVNPRTIVVVNAGSPVAMPWLDDVGAVVCGWFGGMEMADAVVDVLLGAVDPGGRLPITFPHRLDDVPAQPFYAPIDGVQHYGEGWAMGYRGMIDAGTVPLFAFGHGLSYGDIEWGAVTPSSSQLEAAGALELVVEVGLANSASRAGTAVVQGYVTALDRPAPKPSRQLHAFTKLQLAAGEATTAVLRFGRTAFRRWDASTSAWVVEPGRYRVAISRSAIDDHATFDVDVV